MKHTNLLLLLASSFLFACSGDKKNEEQSDQKTTDTIAFVNPPIPDVDVEKEQFTVKAENGDTLYSKSGSIILFPKNSMVDENGKVITGDVKVTYREFNDPVDFFISGISMAYDSGGVSYNFESAGMCELKATKDGKEVFVNQQSKPEINMVSSNEDNSFNLYFLDENKKGWQPKGKDQVVDISASTKSETKKGSSGRKISPPLPMPTAPPVKPNKVEDPGRVIEIETTPGDYPELAAYNNVKFEILKSEKFSPKDAEEEWNEVKVVKTDKPGIYNVRFSNAKRKVSYQARPVLDGQDYAAAMKSFEKQNKEYESMLAGRLNTEKKEKEDKENKMNAEADAIVAQNKITATENARIDRMNALILVRNKEIEAINKVTIANNKKIEDAKALREENEANNEISTNIIRSFQADGFGIWNCDRIASSPVIAVYPTFRFKDGKDVVLPTVFAVFKDLKGLLSFSAGQKVTVSSKGKSCIFGLKDGKLVYVVTEDFRNTNVRGDIGTYTFVVQQSDAKITSAEEIRALVGI